MPSSIGTAIRGSSRNWFLNSVLGKPYQQEGDCYRLAALAQATLFGRALPFIDQSVFDSGKASCRALREHPGRLEWVESPVPVDGALVFMGRAKGRESHCGVYLETEDGGRVLHSDKPHGAALDTVLELQQVAGWRLTYLVPV